jgi:hypothetical protein
LGIYSCKDDPRIIVPKKIRSMGWTMNFAHSWVWLALLMVIASPAVPVIYLKSINDPAGIVLFLIGWAIVLVLACRVMSSARRHEED